MFRTISTLLPVIVRPAACTRGALCAEGSAWRLTQGHSATSCPGSALLGARLARSTAGLCPPPAVLRPWLPVLGPLPFAAVPAPPPRVSALRPGRPLPALPASSRGTSAPARPRSPLRSLPPSLLRAAALPGRAAGFGVGCSEEPGAAGAAVCPAGLSGAAFPRPRCGGPPPVHNRVRCLCSPSAAH